MTGGWDFAKKKSEGCLCWNMKYSLQWYFSENTVFQKNKPRKSKAA